MATNYFPLIANATANTINELPSGDNLDLSGSNIANAVGITSGNITVNDVSTGVVDFTNSANVSLGNVSNLHISGGTSGYVLTTDGSGTLTWTSGGGGSMGATGATGASGLDGATGATGETGSTGLTGATGETGSTGASGIDGATGLTGATGSSGIDGATGATGASGIDGATGETGSTGATGPVAGSNTQVIFNDDNAAGASANLTFDKTTNILTVTGNIVTSNANLGNAVTANFASFSTVTSTGDIYFPTDGIGLIGGMSGPGYPVGSFDTTNYLYLTPDSSFNRASNTTPFTIEMWINPQVNTNGTSYFRGAWDGSTIQYELFTNDASIGDYAGTKLSFGFYDAGWFGILSSETLPTDQWSHVAGVYDGTNATLYLNGVSIGTYTGTWSNVNPNNPLSICQDNTFNGQVTNVRFVNGVAVYTGNFTVPTSQLTITQSSGSNISAITGTQTSLLTLQNGTLIDNSSFAHTIAAGGTGFTIAYVDGPFVTPPPKHFLYDGQGWETNGNLTANYIYGNGYYLTGISSGGGSSISNGTSNVNIAIADGNVTTSVGGTANVFVVSTSGVTATYFNGDGNGISNIQGANVIGDVANANYATFAGTVIASAQPNITSVGILSNLAVADYIEGNGIIYAGYLTDHQIALNTDTNPGVEIGLQGRTSAGTPYIDFHSAAGGADYDARIIVDGGDGTMGTANLTINSALLNITGNANITGNIQASTSNVNFSTSPNITLSDVGNLHIGGGTSGYVLTTDGAGTLSWNATGSPSSISNGTSNVNIATANGDVTTTSNGNTTLTVTDIGANITGYANITGNLIAGNADFSAAANVSLGSVSNVHISGGTSGYVLTTDGAGTLSWAAGGGGGGGASISNGNSNVNIGTANGNITMSAVGNANIVVVTGTGVNVAGTLDTGSGNINTTGNVSGAYFIGNGSLLTGIVASGGSSIDNGTSNVSIPTANGNINMSASGNANIVVVTGTGVNLTGDMTISNALTVTGNAAASNVLIGAGTGGAITGANSISANYFVGNGYYLNTVSAVSVANGNSNVNIPAANGNVTVSVTGTSNVVTITNTGVNVTGTLSTGTANITANYYIGNGSLLTGIAATTTIANGNSNVNIPDANGNVNISAVGNANVLVVTGTGANILGTANITGNLAVNGTNVTIGTGAGGNISGVNVITANTFAQGNSNITIVSNANVNFSVTGTANVASITAAGIITTAANAAITSNSHTASGVATGNANVSTITGNLGFRSLFTTYTDGNAAASSTVANAAIHAFAAPNLAAANLTVTYTNAATMYIAGPPVANTNVTITNPYSLMVGGNARFFGNIIGTVANGNSNVYIAAANGNVTVAAVGNTTLTISGTGVNVAGTGNFSGNLNAGNFIGILANGNSNITMVANANVAIAVTGANRLVVTSTGANIAGTANITGNVNMGANLRVTGQGGLGYNATIGAATQATNRNTAVTISNVTGAITLVSATTTANTINVFTVTNTTVAAADTIILNQRTGNTSAYQIGVCNVAAGSFQVQIFNSLAVAVAEAPILNFAVLKTA